MESNQNGESRRRVILYRGLIHTPELQSDSFSPFFNYGVGFFETILYEKGILQYFNEHLERMKKTCTDFSINLNYDEISEKILHNLLKETGLKNHICRLKILYAPIQDSSRWDTVVTAAPYTRPAGDFTLSVHNEVYDSYLNRYKSNNYQYNLYWKDFYKKRDNSDEVMLCNKEGNILEGSYTNILYFKDGTLYYVDKSNNYLQGIMQDRILIEAEQINELKIQSLKDGIEINQLKQADEVMICNSLMTIQNVRKINFGDIVFKWPSSPQSNYLAAKIRKKLCF
ncbi:MAG: aminotransferase class IV [Spirochaetaceae bacterium]|jgi:4-amino-4-deoxychorismate lyase|nr:aminotransferase class IV [Spirochaetaceae bacterium]